MTGYTPPDRRAQTHHSDFVSGSLSSSSGRSAPQDTEAAIQEESEEEEEEDLDDDFRPHPVRERARSTGEDALLANIQWDEDLTPAPSSESRRFDFRTPTLGSARWPGTSPFEDEDNIPTPRAGPGERTPLIARPSPSQTSLSRPAPIQVNEQAMHHAALQRRISTTSVRSKASLKTPKHHHVGHSTFAQTVRIHASSGSNL